MTKILEAQDVWKVYSHGSLRVEAVRGANLALGAGELVAVMGPSGSGKTTFLTMLGAMLTPTKGDVRIAGQSIAGLRPQELAKLRRRHIGFVFQSFNLFPALTACQNVEVGLRLRGRSPEAAKAQALEALDGVGLVERADFLPEDLSGGQKQRVSIARALAGGPRLILADEPTGALDTSNGRAVIELLTNRARETGAAVVVVTHDPRVSDLMDRVLTMEDGRLRDEKALETL
jgi:putative ABC transport system ATP-binding protein